LGLSAAPTFTVATAAGNVLAAQTLAASTAVTSSVFYVGTAGQSGAAGTTTTGSALSGRLQVWCGGNTAVAAVSGLQVQVFSTSDGTKYDSVPYAVNGVIAAVISTTTVQSWDLPPGQYKLTVTNLDATNSLLNVEASLGTTA
jgi:hypothetical protein